LPPECLDEPDKKIKSSAKIVENVTYSDILDFFIDYANCESLGVIANTHLIQADLDLENYADNPKCRLLAKLHGKAVDFAKSGEMPQMPKECRVY
jgi:RNA-dependent RNA polymerase